MALKESVRKMFFFLVLDRTPLSLLKSFTLNFMRPPTSL